MPSIKVSQLWTYRSIFKVDYGRKIGSHSHKIDCKVDYPTCRIPLMLLCYEPFTSHWANVAVLAPLLARCH